MHPVTYERDLPRAEKEEKLDFGSFLSGVIDGVRAFFGPTQQQVDAAGMSFGEFLCALGFQLLSAPSQARFEAVLTSKATPETIREFERRVNDAATKLWLRQVTERKKVTDLQPPKEHPDLLALALKEDVTERLEAFTRGIKRHERVKARLPPKARVDALNGRFLVSFVAVHMAAALPAASFQSWIIERAHEVCTQALKSLGDLYHLPAESLVTKRDVKSVDEHFAKSDAAHDEHERLQRDRYKAEISEAIYFDDI